jgi:hypothetical protein
MPTRAYIGCKTKSTGDASEALILWKLADAGLTVLIPWGDNTRFDLVAQVQDKFLRIQCKTGRLRDGYVSFITCGVGRDGNRYYYSPGGIDYYGVRCLETAVIYLVPYEEAGSSSMPHLRTEPPKPGSTGGRQVARVRWAGKYDADLVIESWLRTGGSFEPLWTPPAFESVGHWHPNRPRIGTRDSWQALASPRL